jgi:hypothetical protein
MKELKITAKSEQEFKEQVYEIARSVGNTEDLAEFVNFLSSYPLDYGTVVYAQCAAMIAAQHVMNEGEQGGITGFQAGFVGWEMVKQFMLVGKCGLTIIDWENMLYPQHKDRFEKTISKGIFENLQEVAKKRIAEADENEGIEGHSLHPEVRKHMESIVNGVVPFGYVIKED